ncbi:hypothetical protein CDL15_Pgr008534 [Punica granatum]|uniref:protein-serine/threonine phosphatase n=1 Tax=Punica granatum TaxID=22663 RepID=A0A218WPR1_PUNGR|nr:hypothetical protein CDL15_Pgr008534 [Punica granatum]
MTMAMMTGMSIVGVGLGHGHGGGGGGGGGGGDGVAVSSSSAGVIGACVAVLLMLFFILLLLFLACKPWRFLSPFRSSLTHHHRNSLKAEDLERPLVPDRADLVQEQGNESARNYEFEGLRLQAEEYLSSPRLEGLVHKQRVPSLSSHVNQGDSVVLDVVPDIPEDAYLGQTLKRPYVINRSIEERKRSRIEDLTPSVGSDGSGLQASSQKDIGDQRSCLTLEVVSGPSQGMSCSIRSSDTKRLPLTLGRVPPSDLQLKDSEVSGKHAMINWNLNKLKWELLDMGSLNGTLLNAQPINHPDSSIRHWGDPMELADGDIITLGTTSNVSVQITSQTEDNIPFGVGMASDPMALRRGGKKLAMEDVCYYQWPLPGLDQFGVFGICDGHGGAAAAKSASKSVILSQLDFFILLCAVISSPNNTSLSRIIPEMIASLLSDSLNREKVLSLCDASHILRDAFYRAEACMDHYYEGCTATVLLIWADGNGNFFAQCANIGDSACIVNIDEKLIKMTEDHRIVSQSERLRIREMGEPLREGETRLCGLNLARMLGDKFIKQQDKRFSAEPYVSQVVHVDRASRAFALMASDGLWDVISLKKATQLVLQAKERHTANGEDLAEKVATLLLSEARNLRTKDNTSIIFLDFSTTSPCNVDS